MAGVLASASFVKRNSTYKKRMRPHPHSRMWEAYSTYTMKMVCARFALAWLLVNLDFSGEALIASFDLEFEYSILDTRRSFIEVEV